MINQRINWCLTFYQGICPHLTMMTKIYLFPQVLNFIDIKLAEANCLDCRKHIDRRALSTKSILEGKALKEGRTTMSSQIEKGQHVRTIFKLPSNVVTSRSVVWKAKGRM